MQKYAENIQKNIQNVCKIGSVYYCIALYANHRHATNIIAAARYAWGPGLRVGP